MGFNSGFKGLSFTNSWNFSTYWDTAVSKLPRRKGHKPARDWTFYRKACPLRLPRKARVCAILSAILLISAHSRTHVQNRHICGENLGPILQLWDGETRSTVKLALASPQHRGMFTYCHLFLIGELISCWCVQQKRWVKNVNIPSIRGKRDGCEIKCQYSVYQRQARWLWNKMSIFRLSEASEMAVK